jgi:hypothetical protein
MQCCEFNCLGKRAFKREHNVNFMSVVTEIPQASTEHIAVMMRQLLQQACRAYSLNICGRRYTTCCVQKGEIAARTVRVTFRPLATALTTLRPSYKGEATAVL